VPAESVDFANGARLGGLSAPIHLNISSTVTAVEDVQNANKFSVYPNLIKDNYIVTLNSGKTSNAVVNLYNTQGKLVKSIYNGSVNSTKVIDVTRDNSLPKGLYFIKATVGDNQFVQKVVLQ